MADDDKHCGTCKHWDNSPIMIHERYYDHSTKLIANPNARRWDCHSEDQKLGECRKANEPRDDIVDDKRVDIVTAPLMQAVCDGEGIYGELITDARFGCILYEPKEKSESHG